MITEPVMVYGKHVVKEALTTCPHVLRSVQISENTEDQELMGLLKKAGIKYAPLNLKKLPQGIPFDAVHQGVVASIDTSRLMREYNEFMNGLEITNDTAIVILGEVQDPHNVGAIIRSAAAFGVAAVLIPEHRQVQVNGTIIKVSAGMAFHVPLISIGNVNQTIRDLKERGFWVYGLEGEAKQTVTNETFERPSAFVVGNEATGVREKTLEHCDIPLRIPMHSQTESLNASVSAAVVLYAWSAKHPSALK